MVRRGDDEWLAIVKWVVYGLIESEEVGITSANVEKLKADSADPVVQRLLGKTEDTGKLLGLDREWLARAVAQVGNYGEIFERNVGEKTPLALKRGPNALWTQGGLQYAIPIR
jgi:general L-amino acid transport system substrate-binding protein